MTAPRGKFNDAFRRYSEIAMNVALLGGVTAAVSQRLGLQGKLSVTRYELKLPPERRLAQPLRIAFASDFHAGPTTHPAIFHALFKQLEHEQPDLLLLGGDFISGKANNVAHLSPGLAACRPPLGKYAVYGNHDLWSDHHHLGRKLEAAGVRMLVNANVMLPEPFHNVSLCGMDDPWTGAPDGRATFAGAAATRVLLMHAPDGLLLLDGHRFDAGFAGHTHGGQVALPGGAPIITPGGPLSRRYHYGRFDLEEHGCLMVSRGVGCSTIPFRVNADPELVLCTMQ